MAERNCTGRPGLGNPENVAINTQPFEAFVSSTRILEWSAPCLTKSGNRMRQSPPEKKDLPIPGD